MDLQEFYNRVRSLTPGTSIQYNGLKLEKAEGASEISPPDHTEVTVYNNGSKVESLTLDVMDFDQFKEILDKIVEVDPDDLQEWLDR